MNAGPFDPRTQRLFGFIAAAVGIHLLLAIKLPPAVPRAAPDRVLSVILEKEPVVTNPRKPEPSPSRGPMTSGDSDTDYTANDERTPPGVTTTTEPAGSPSVHELLQPVPEVSREKHKPFSLKPDTHLIFEPERTVRPPSGRRLLDESIWRRDRVEKHIRYASLDGRGIWIKHFDNGDMQVCEHPYDDPFDHVDDYWPFACDRPG